MDDIALKNGMLVKIVKDSDNRGSALIGWCGVVIKESDLPGRAVVVRFNRKHNTGSDGTNVYDEYSRYYYPHELEISDQQAFNDIIDLYYNTSE